MATAKEIRKLFNQFNKLKVAVVGDCMVDKYVYGNVDRISPEAPVPVLSINNSIARSGGAANVAMNLHALGAAPVLFSVIGADVEGDKLLEILKDTRIKTNYIFRSASRITTSKTRIISKNHQMMRIDHEMTENLDAAMEKKVLNALTSFLKKEKPDVLIFEDYDKGMLSANFIMAVIEICNVNNIPVAVDPKKKNFFAYQNCTLFKPNLREIKESLNINIDAGDLGSLNIAADILQKQLKNNSTMITLGEHGIFIKTGKKFFKKDAYLRNVADVSGAGDTVISIAALCLAVNADAQLTAGIANIAGGLVCESSGVVPVDKKQLLQECLSLLC